MRCNVANRQSSTKHDQQATMYRILRVKCVVAGSNQLERQNPTCLTGSSRMRSEPAVQGGTKCGLDRLSGGSEVSVLNHLRYNLVDQTGAIYLNRQIALSIVDFEVRQQCKGMIIAGT